MVPRAGGRGHVPDPQIEALRAGGQPPPPADELTRQCVSLFATMAADPRFVRAGLECIGTLTPVQDVLQRPDVAERVTRAMNAMRTVPPPSMPGPTRAQLVSLAT